MVLIAFAYSPVPLNATLRLPRMCVVPGEILAASEA